MQIMSSAMALGFGQGSRKMRGVQSGDKSGSPVQKCCGKKAFPASGHEKSHTPAN